MSSTRLSTVSGWGGGAGETSTNRGATPALRGGTPPPDCSADWQADRRPSTARTHAARRTYGRHKCFIAVRQRYCTLVPRSTMRSLAQLSSPSRLAPKSSPSRLAHKMDESSRKWIFRRRDLPGILGVPLLLPLPKLPVGSRGRDRERDRIVTGLRNQWRVSLDPTVFSPRGPTRRW
jgi:hypothetical protein